MAVFNLNLNGDYSKQLLSYYIWVKIPSRRSVKWHPNKYHRDGKF